MTWLDNVTGRGTITVEPLAWLPLEFLCFNMRAIDAEEIYSNLASGNPLEWAGMIHQAVAKQGCAWIARLDGRPTAVIGCFENFPGNWQIFSFGTEAYPRVLVAFLPYWQPLQSFALDRGMHRLECKSLSSHKEAHGFLRLMGFTQEATLLQYGRDRQDYFLFRRIWGDDSHVLRRGRQLDTADTCTAAAAA
jgi:RimJ/RimL family protein N-acetyltransferase